MHIKLSLGFQNTQLAGYVRMKKYLIASLFNFHQAKYIYSCIIQKEKKCPKIQLCQIWGRGEGEEEERKKNQNPKRGYHKFIRPQDRIYQYITVN